MENVLLPMCQALSALVEHGNFMAPLPPIMHYKGRLKVWEICPFLCKFLVTFRCGGNLEHNMLINEFLRSCRGV